jgi:hypothetical protein
MLSSMEMEMEEVTGSVTLEAREARRQYLISVQVQCDNSSRLTDAYVHCYLRRNA